MNFILVAFLGLIMLEILQQIFIWVLVRKLEKYMIPKIYKRK